MPILRRTIVQENWRKNENPVPACRNGIFNTNANGWLALYFGLFFLLGLFFLFLELELVADEFEDGHLGVVADAVSCMNNACVAASAIREFRRDLAEQLLRDGRQHDVGSRLTARLQRVALA